MIVLFAAFLVAILLLGLYSPRSGADVLGWRPTRAPELEQQNEVDDIAQMLDASNALRRRAAPPSAPRTTSPPTCTPPSASWTGAPASTATAG